MLYIHGGCWVFPPVYPWGGTAVHQRTSFVSAAPHQLGHHGAWPAILKREEFVGGTTTLVGCSSQSEPAQGVLIDYSRLLQPSTHVSACRTASAAWRGVLLLGSTQTSPNAHVVTATRDLLVRACSLACCSHVASSTGRSDLRQIKLHSQGVEVMLQQQRWKLRLEVNEGSIQVVQ